MLLAFINYIYKVTYSRKRAINKLYLVPFTKFLYFFFFINFTHKTQHNRYNQIAALLKVVNVSAYTEDYFINIFMNVFKLVNVHYITLLYISVFKTTLILKSVILQSTFVPIHLSYLPFCRFWAAGVFSTACAPNKFYFRQ